jgi:hypothetical protein
MLEGITPRDWIEILGVVITIGTVLWRFSAATTTFQLIGQQQATEISKMAISIDKLEASVTAIAVQDVKITALMERMNQSDQRADARFNKLETMIDDLRHGRGLVR